jgi:pimeloyl-ACP methyl ester carboxylesterase
MRRHQFLFASTLIVFFQLILIQNIFAQGASAQDPMKPNPHAVEDFKGGIYGDFSVTCQDFGSPLTGGFCIHRRLSSHNSDILYYFHGLGGDLTYWSGSSFYPAQVRQMWDEKHEDAPIVISISFGQVWLLAQKNSSPYSGLFEALVDNIIPQIEAMLGGLKGRRLLLGESMGGFNSMQLALKTHLFTKVAALCVPMADLPFDADGEAMQKYIEKSTAWQYYKDSAPNLMMESVSQMVQLTHTFYPLSSDWDAANPLTLMNSVEIQGLPQLYMAAGAYDRFALFEQDQNFARTLLSRGAQLEWRPQWGGHCAIDIPTLADFLIK